MLCFVQKEDGHPPEVTKPNNKSREPLDKSQQEDQHKTVQDNPSLDQRKPVEKYQHKPPDERKSTNLRKFSEPNQPSEIRQFFKELRPPDIKIPYTASGPIKSSVEAGNSSVEATITPTSVDLEVDPHHPARIRPASDSSDNSSTHLQSTEVRTSLHFPSTGIKTMLKGACCLKKF